MVHTLTRLRRRLRLLGGTSMDGDKDGDTDREREGAPIADVEVNLSGCKLGWDGAMAGHISGCRAPMGSGLILLAARNAAGNTCLVSSPVSCTVRGK